MNFLVSNSNQHCELILHGNCNFDCNPELDFCATTGGIFVFSAFGYDMEHNLIRIKCWSEVYSHAILWNHFSQWNSSIANS